MQITGKFLTDAWLQKISDYAMKVLEPVKEQYKLALTDKKLPHKYVDFARAVDVLGANTVQCLDLDMRALYTAIMRYYTLLLKKPDDLINVSRRIQRSFARLRSVYTTQMFKDWAPMTFFFVSWEDLNLWDCQFKSWGTVEAHSLVSLVHFLMCYAINVIYLTEASKSVLDMPEELAKMYLMSPDSALITTAGTYIAKHNLLTDTW